MNVATDSWECARKTEKTVLSQVKSSAVETHSIAFYLGNHHSKAVSNDEASYSVCRNMDSQTCHCIARVQITVPGLTYMPEGSFGRDPWPLIIPAPPLSECNLVLASSVLLRN